MRILMIGLFPTLNTQETISGFRRLKKKKAKESTTKYLKTF